LIPLGFTAWGIYAVGWKKGLVIFIPVLIGSYSLFTLIWVDEIMVRKGIVRARARKGILPSKNQGNDRARVVSQLFKTFSSYLSNDTKPKMINFSKEVLEIGESDAIFSGKDPYISGIAVFVFACRKFSYNGRCPVTYNQIRFELGHFVAGQSFLSMLKDLAKKFP